MLWAHLALPSQLSTRRSLVSSNRIRSTFVVSRNYLPAPQVHHRMNEQGGFNNIANYKTKTRTATQFRRHFCARVEHGAWATPGHAVMQVISGKSRQRMKAGCHQKARAHLLE